MKNNYYLVLVTCISVVSISAAPVFQHSTHQSYQRNAAAPNQHQSWGTARPQLPPPSLPYPLVPSTTPSAQNYGFYTVGPQGSQPVIYSLQNFHGQTQPVSQYTPPHANNPTLSYSFPVLPFQPPPAGRYALTHQVYPEPSRNVPSIQGQARHAYLNFVDAQRGAEVMAYPGHEYHASSSAARGQAPVAYGFYGFPQQNPYNTLSDARVADTPAYSHPPSRVADSPDDYSTLPQFGRHTTADRSSHPSQLEHQPSPDRSSHFGYRANSGTPDHASSPYPPSSRLRDQASVGTSRPVSPEYGSPQRTHNTGDLNPPSTESSNRMSEDSSPAVQSTPHQNDRSNTKFSDLKLPPLPSHPLAKGKGIFSDPNPGLLFPKAHQMRASWASSHPQPSAQGNSLSDMHASQDPDSVMDDLDNSHSNSRNSPPVSPPGVQAPNPSTSQREPSPNFDSQKYQSPQTSRYFSQMFRASAAAHISKPLTYHPAVQNMDFTEEQPHASSSRQNYASAAAGPSYQNYESDASSDVVDVVPTRQDRASAQAKVRQPNSPARDDDQRMSEEHMPIGSTTNPNVDSTAEQPLASSSRQNYASAAAGPSHQDQESQGSSSDVVEVVPTREERAAARAKAIRSKRDGKRKVPGGRIPAQSIANRDDREAARREEPISTRSRQGRLNKKKAKAEARARREQKVKARTTRWVQQQEQASYAPPELDVASESDKGSKSDVTSDEASSESYVPSN